MLRILLFWLCGFGIGLADVTSPPALPEQACSAAGRAAEQRDALPANLLQSIGLVESGRADPMSGQIAAWPWTVNVDGVGYYFADEPEAAKFAARSEATAGDVDVGCFQISLEQHPGAFPSMDAAFDPAGNAAFAAGFLKQLKVRSGSWALAVAQYHSALPAIGLAYQQRVMAALAGGWPEFGGADFSGQDPVVILAGPAARLVRVITMTGATPPAPPDQNWLPRVITP